MNETELIRELARRASVDHGTARAVFDALIEVVREGRIADQIMDRGTVHIAGPAGEPALLRQPAPASAPDSRAVDELIDRAHRHPLGVEFLVKGYLGSVAAEFGVHAFTVDEARHRLQGDPLAGAVCKGNS